MIAGLSESGRHATRIRGRACCYILHPEPRIPALVIVASVPFEAGQGTSFIADRETGSACQSPDDWYAMETIAFSTRDSGGGIELNR